MAVTGINTEDRLVQATFAAHLTDKREPSNHRGIEHHGMLAAVPVRPALPLPG